MRCCICGKEIISLEPTILFVNEDLEEKLICESCENKSEILLNGNDENQRKRCAEFFYQHAQRINDQEVKDCVLNMLREIDYRLPGGNVLDNSTASEQSGWISIVRSLTWVGVVVCIIAAIALGILLGELFNIAIGFIVAIIGILAAFVSPAWTMILLDAAEDIHRIRICAERK